MARYTAGVTGYPGVRNGRGRSGRFQRGSNRAHRQHREDRKADTRVNNDALGRSGPERTSATPSLKHGGDHGSARPRSEPRGHRGELSSLGHRKHDPRADQDIALMVERSIKPMATEKAADHRVPTTGVRRSGRWVRRLPHHTIRGCYNPATSRADKAKA